jgi:hypothetical protein
MPTTQLEHRSKDYGYLLPSALDCYNATCPLGAASR